MCLNHNKHCQEVAPVSHLQTQAFDLPEHSNLCASILQIRLRTTQVVKVMKGEINFSCLVKNGNVESFTAIL